jgi:hypothetical protein
MLTGVTRSRYIDCMKKMTVQELVRESGLKARTIQIRAKNLGYEPDPQIGRHLFTQAQATKIINFPDRRRRRKPETELKPQSRRARKYRDAKVSTKAAKKKSRL